MAFSNKCSRVSGICILLPLKIKEENCKIDGWQTWGDDGKGAGGLGGAKEFAWKGRPRYLCFYVWLVSCISSQRRGGYSHKLHWQQLSLRTVDSMNTWNSGIHCIAVIRGIHCIARCNTVLRLQTGRQRSYCSNCSAVIQLVQLLQLLQLHSSTVFNVAP